MSATFYDLTLENRPEDQRDDDLYAFMDEAEERLEELFSMTFALTQRVLIGSK